MTRADTTVVLAETTAMMISFLLGHGSRCRHLQSVTLCRVGYNQTCTHGKEGSKYDIISTLVCLSLKSLLGCCLNSVAMLLCQSARSYNIPLLALLHHLGCHALVRAGYVHVFTASPASPIISFSNLIMSGKSSIV